MQDFFRLFKKDNLKSDSDLIARLKVRTSKHWQQPSRSVLRPTHISPVAPNAPFAAPSLSIITASASSLACNRESSSEENESSTVVRHSALTEYLSPQNDHIVGLLEQTEPSNTPSTGLAMPSIASNLANVSGSCEQPSAIDASVHVSHQGVTYNIGGSAVVHLIYGSQIDQRCDRYLLDAIIRNLERSHNAEYDMVINATRGPCTPQTRTSILQKLGDWCNAKGVVLFWINGMAGTGKTTIAYSFCQILEAANLLGASFFCSRSLPDCRNVNIIIPTVAFQLAQRYPPFAEALAEALHKDVDILQRGLDIQLHKLIIGPWNAKKEQLPQHIVIVLDALDECDERHSGFLQTIINHVATLPFKIMITSRPEPSIRDILIKKAQISGTLTTFILHEVEKDLVQEDIAKYLDAELSPHVGPDDIHFLTNLAGALFIFAATLARFLTTKGVNITLRIKLLRDSLPTGTKLKMLELLDELYKGVLRAAFHHELMEEEVQEMKEILFTVVCAREPLTQQAIASLWKVTEKEVEDRLDALRSVIFFPPSHHQTLTTFHASFQDFMLDQSRSKEFYCHPLHFHLEMAKQCLAFMKIGLHQNLCHLHGRPPNDSVDPDLIGKSISPGLRYACIYWSEHWMISDRSERQGTLSSIYGFLITGVLYWFECLSHIGRLAVSIESLSMLRDALHENTKLVNITHDTLRFIQHVYNQIEYSAMETYGYALAWVPLESSLRTHFSSLFEQAPRVLCGLPSTWTGPDQAFRVPSVLIYSIAISRDGRSIICGSYDQTVRIWNVRSHVEECVLTGHTGCVSSVDISGDGSRAISGSDDRSVRVWDIATHDVVFTLQSDGGVGAVALSLNDKWIASGHNDGSVRVWDATDGHLIHSLKEHTACIYSVSFAHDNTRLVSGSEDETARLWDVVTGTKECVLRGHRCAVLSVACSPHGGKVATSSWDKTARLWDMSGKELHVLGAHSNWVNCVAFTPDGKQLVTGSDDGTMRIWDVVTGATVRMFIVQAGPVVSVSVFPDGLKIASNTGRTISMWSLRGGHVIGGEEQKDGIDETPLAISNVEAKRMVFSTKGRRVLLLPSLRILDTATLEEKVILDSDSAKYGFGALSTSESRVAASTDEAVKVWELTCDDILANYFTLEGHTGYINTVFFSHNEHQLVSASSDRTARVWDAATGDQIYVLSHPSSVHNALFSRDDIQIVSNTVNSVHIWDAQSGEQLRQFGTTEIYSATFSPDSRHIIIPHTDNLNITTFKIYNAKTFQLEHAHKGYKHWTIMSDNSSYVLSDIGWVYHFSHLGGQPRRLLWIPFQYQAIFHSNKISLFTPTPTGVQVCLPREDGLVTLIIPRDA